MLYCLFLFLYHFCTHSTALNSVACMLVTCFSIFVCHVFMKGTTRRVWNTGRGRRHWLDRLWGCARSAWPARAVRRPWRDRHNGIHWPRRRAGLHGQHRQAGSRGTEGQSGPGRSEWTGWNPGSTRSSWTAGRGRRARHWTDRAAGCSWTTRKCRESRSPRCVDLSSLLDCTAMHGIKCGLLLQMLRGLSVSVCLLVTTVSHAEWLNWSRCRLGMDLGGPKEPRTRWGPDPPSRRGNIGGVSQPSVKYREYLA